MNWCEFLDLTYNNEQPYNDFKFLIRITIMFEYRKINLNAK